MPNKETVKKIREEKSKKLFDRFLLASDVLVGNQYGSTYTAFTLVERRELYKFWKEQVAPRLHFYIDSDT